jgi:phenylacetic acid degradation operon negative regulatory protein
MLMKPRTEELLNFLLWTADKLVRPTFRNLTDSYESWAYRNGLLRQLKTLEKQHLLERDSQGSAERLYRLTEQGRLHSLGGRDPDKQWARPWDGCWRLVLFDVPVTQRTRRQRLRRYLRARGFGCLQGSVWVTPDPLQTEREILAGGKVDVASMLLLEARPCAGESDAEIVAGGWVFEHINRLYAQHLDVLKQRPAGPPRDPPVAKAFQCWAARERQAWLGAVTLDPLLPQALLPPNYLGCQSWQQRRKALRGMGQYLRAFRQ